MPQFFHIHRRVFSKSKQQQSDSNKAHKKQPARHIGPAAFVFQRSQTAQTDHFRTAVSGNAISKNRREKSNFHFYSVKVHLQNANIKHFISKFA
jgi:hypothetical protein